MKNVMRLSVLICSLVVLSACGNTKTDRTLSGAGIGAAVGGVGGLLLGSPGTGAIVGGAVGAAAGGLTDKSDIDLGDPIWK